MNLTLGHVFGRKAGPSQQTLRPCKTSRWDLTSEMRKLCPLFPSVLPCRPRRGHRGGFALGSGAWQGGLLWSVDSQGPPGTGTDFAVLCPRVGSHPGSRGTALRGGLVGEPALASGVTAQEQRSSVERVGVGRTAGSSLAGGCVLWFSQLPSSGGCTPWQVGPPPSYKAAPLPAPPLCAGEIFRSISQFLEPCPPPAPGIEMMGVRVAHGFWS